MLTFGQIDCNAGGIALAAKNANFEIEFLVEENEACLETLRHNFGSKAKLILDFSRQQQFDYVLPEVGLFAFTPPQHKFSMISKKRVDFEKEVATHYAQPLRYLKEMKPAFFITEFTVGITYKHDVFKWLLDKFTDLNYIVNRLDINYEEWGVPQKRQKIIIVGEWYEGNDFFNFPKPPDTPEIPAKDALYGIPDDTENHYFIQHNPLTVERIESVKPGDNLWQGDNEFHKFENTNMKVDSAYRRLHPDWVSPTVPARGGGGALLYHWKEPRALTSRECARLQSFPDDYKFCGNLKDVRWQVGDATPPRGIQPIIQHIWDILV